MRKKIGLNELRETDVPAALDAKILAAAAFSAARNRKRIFRRRFIAGISTAAAASLALVAGLFVADTRTSASPAAAVPAIQRAAIDNAPAQPVKNTADLETLQDFTNFEQTSFVLGQVTAYSGLEATDDDLFI